MGPDFFDESLDEFELLPHAARPATARRHAIDVDSRDLDIVPSLPGPRAAVRAT
jgi:hypothetical protein